MARMGRELRWRAVRGPAGVVDELDEGHAGQEQDAGDDGAYLDMPVDQAENDEDDAEGAGGEAAHQAPELTGN